jgi:hypothetical protein
MPKREIRQLELECDFCGEKEVFDLASHPKDILPRLKEWRGVINAGDPAGQGMPDMTKWYDSARCIASGVKRDEEMREREAKVASMCGEDSRLTPAAQASGAVIKELPNV